MSSSKLLQDLGLALFYNTAVGLFLTAVTPYGLALNLLYAQCIGLSIYVVVRASCRVFGMPRPGLGSAAIGIPLGGLIGFTLATWIRGDTLVAAMETHPDAAMIAAATALTFGILAIWHFHDEARMLEAQAEARAERLRRSEQEALTTRTELALLQAQIEPHFLFNTLSNVVGLIDTEPAAARRMLIDLTALLRTSLARTRRTHFALGDEIELLRAYLGIMSVRMGSRLRWQVDADPAVMSARLPPLLVQPLVENAIRHGIEPSPDGGELTIRCRREGDDLLIAVCNSGLPFAPGPRQGLGLANVRERLESFYGSRAGLELHAGAVGGLEASIRLPFVDHEPAPADR